MKITIVLPDAVAYRARQYITAKYGAKARAMSLVIQEALREYLKKHSRDLYKPSPGVKHPPRF